MNHSPRYQFDCKRCKFNWNCGYVCQCVYETGKRKLPEPPEEIKIMVDDARRKRPGITLQYETGEIKQQSCQQ